VTDNLNVGIPDGSQQIFATLLARLKYFLAPTVQMTFSNYFNAYQSTYPFSCPSGKCTYTSNGYVFETTTHGHYDPRLSFEWRPQSNLAVRFSAGSAIAPPYLNLLSALNNKMSYSFGSSYVTQTLNAGNLQPETAFGYDLGASYRFKDGVTFLSGDLYRTNLFNEFLSTQTWTGWTCATVPAGQPSCPSSVPAADLASTNVFFSYNTNLSNARYEGLELQLQRVPDSGFGYKLQGALMRGYAYDLPPCFYSFSVSGGKQDCTQFNTNVAIIPGQNFNGGTGFGLVAGQVGGAFAKIGVSNQNIPYLMGYGELNYKFGNGGMLLFGENLYGKNNSFNLPPFWVATASIREPIAPTMDLQLTGYNVFNAHSGLFPTWGAGVGIPLANGQIGATEANVVGPAQWRLVFTKHLGSGQ
jgi:outer membrane receptor protein involved in Fe transport